MKLNPLFAADMYKTGHVKMYPEGTEYVYSNFTARSSRLAPKLKDTFDEKIVFFGLQGFIKYFLIDLFNEQFFNVPKEQAVGEYKAMMDKCLGPDAVDVSHIAALHDLGYLPLRIKALPEGSLVDIKVPVLTVTNTVIGFGWLVGYLEDAYSNNLWKPTTTATTAYQYRKLLTDYAEKTGAPKEFILWQGHDFSLRGLSGSFDGAQSAPGHLLSFLGTDTISAIEYLEKYYKGSETFVGGSVPATEHSVMCMGGADEGEYATIKRLITDLYPSGIVSIVSDTWDYWNVITNTAAQLKDIILARKPDALGNAKVVFRPDSGDPVKIVAGLRVTDIDDVCEDNIYSTDVAVKDGKYYEFDYSFCGDSCNCLMDIELGREVSEHEVKGSVECLWDIFGGTLSETGHKMLNPRVGLIYGDSITLERAQQILKRLEAKGFASSNIVFGIGSYTYQHVTRDSYGFAMKATYGIVNGEPRNIFKDPKTGDGMKKSAKGLLCVEYEDGRFVLYDEQTPEEEKQGLLRTVFEDGKLVVEDSLEKIRKRLWP
jgi:nicotinamide phosphoribosyltransferase